MPFRASIKSYQQYHNLPYSYTYVYCYTASGTIKLYVFGDPKLFLTMTSDPDYLAAMSYKQYLNLS